MKRQFDTSYQHARERKIEEFRRLKAQREKLEQLISQYDTAIHAPRPCPETIDELCSAVEAEADRIGYDNHARLQALHTAAESVCARIDAPEGHTFESTGVKR